MSYREVLLDFTPDKEEFSMMFDRCHTEIERVLSNSIYNTSISGVKFSWTTLYVYGRCRVAHHHNHIHSLMRLIRT